MIQITGGPSGSGWDIGELPEERQLANVIQMVPGVVYLQTLYCFARIINEPGMPKVDIEEIKNNPFILPVSGEHRIQLTEHVIRR